METMQSWFGLKDHHKDFSIENDADRRLFFARNELNEQLHRILRRSFRTGNPPKLVLYGDWGVGKTHTMRHIQYVIETRREEFPAQIVFVELPDITAKSTFRVAHAALLDALGIDLAKSWVLQYHTNHSSDAERRIHEATQSSDIAKAFGNLSGFGGAAPIAWEWLRGVPLSAADARFAGLSPALDQSNQLVRVLQMFGALCEEIEKKLLVFMLDEATKLEYITNQDSINHWLNAFKLIADSQTKEIGFIVSGSWVDTDDMALPLQNQQVMSRFGSTNYIPLHNLDSEDTNEFITDLLGEWIDPERRGDILKRYQGEADGESIQADTFPYACREGGNTNPRDIQKTLDDLLNRAMDDNRHIASSAYIGSLVNA